MNDSRNNQSLYDRNKGLREPRVDAYEANREQRETDRANNRETQEFTASLRDYSPPIQEAA